MSLYFNIAQIVLAVLLIITILLQQKGSGLGAAFGGGDGGATQTRRGPEKAIFITTIVLSILFLGTALARIILA